MDVESMKITASLTCREVQKDTWWLPMGLNIHASTTTDMHERNEALHDKYEQHQ